MSRNSQSLARSRKLSLENLETRKLMAGNISAVLDSEGILQIRGDSAANGVAIYQVSDTTIRVAGLTQGGTGTAVNGSTSSRDFRNVQGLNVELNSGSDRVEIGSAASLARTTSLPRGATILSGSGDDVVKIDKTATMGDVNIVGGTGNDSVTLNQVKVGSTLDEFRRGALSIETGYGSDRINVSNTTVNQSIYIESGVGLASDQVTLNTVTAGQHVALVANEPDNFRVDTNLRAELRGVTAGGNVSVDARGAQSQITMKQVTADAVFAELGAKDDSLNLESIDSDWTQVSGGYGYDTLTTYMAGKVFRTGFEWEYNPFTVLILGSFL